MLSTNVEQVPPVGYGGTELIVYLLTQALVRCGHDVTLFAPKTSSTLAQLISVVDKPLRLDDNIPIRRWQAYDIIALQKLEKIIDEFDIVHNHMGYQALPMLSKYSQKVVTTMHNPIRDYCAPIYLNYPNLNYVPISDAYKNLNYGYQLNYTQTIYNGIDVDLFPLKNFSNQQYLLFIGRVCYDKGTHTAISIANKLGLPLKIAGKIDSSDLNYFNEFVKPDLKGNISYVGEVNHEEKLKLYHEAMAVLYPITFNEPFGLVMVEAICTGTPVLAFNKGSVAEIIEDGITGIIADDEAELISKFKIGHSFNKDILNLKIKTKFSSQIMVEKYLELYLKVANST